MNQEEKLLNQIYEAYLAHATGKKFKNTVTKEEFDHLFAFVAFCIEFRLDIDKAESLSMISQLFNEASSATNEKAKH